MRPASVLSEAWRNLVGGTTRAAWLALVLLVTVGGLAVADTRAIVTVLAGAEAYRTAGASVQTLTSDTAGSVDGRRCDALSAVGGITAAGALREGEPVRALAMPASSLTVWEVTGGVLDVVTRSARPVATTGGDGVWLSADLAETLGVDPGDRLPTDAGQATVAGVYTWPEDGRDRMLGYAMLAPVAADGSFDHCWAGVWPADTDTTGLLYSTLAPGTSGPQQNQINTTLGAEYDAGAEIAGRVTAPATPVAAVVGAVLGYAGVRLRRLELASALHARVPKPQLAAQLGVETACWVAAATLVGAAVVGLTAHLGNPDPAGPTWLTGLRPLATGGAAALLGALAGVLATREQHLFRYFKER